MTATSLTERAALIVVRGGELAVGAAEAIAEAGGTAILVGDRVERAADALQGTATHLELCEVPGFAPGAVAAALATSGVLDPFTVIVVPASPDGRDLAPRLAATLHRPLHAGAARVGERDVTVVRAGGLAMQHVAMTGPCVVTLIPGLRDAGERRTELPSRTVHDLSLAPREDAETVAILPADVATIDLSEATRIVGGGAGLDGPTRFAQLTELGRLLGASVGVTRVITDRGWVDHHRQIGTTGVVVDPRLYLALGISGAVQHTAGLGHPEHIVSVNTDPHCPMMSLADLAVVADANAVLDELLALLDAERPDSPAAEQR